MTFKTNDYPPHFQGFLFEDKTTDELFNMEVLGIKLYPKDIGNFNIQIHIGNLCGLVAERCTGYDKINNSVNSEDLKRMGEWLIKVSESTFS